MNHGYPATFIHKHTTIPNREIETISLKFTRQIFTEFFQNFKKIIINLSQKKARPPLGVVLPRCERFWLQLIVTASDFVAALDCLQHLPVLALLPGEWGRTLISVELWGFYLPRRFLCQNASKMRKNSRTSGMHS